MDKSTITILVLVMLLNVVDCYLTYQYLTPETELNPIASYIWKKMGFLSIVGLKFTIVPSLCYLVYKQRPTFAFVVSGWLFFWSLIPIVMFALLLI